MTQDIALGIGCDRNTPHATLAQVIDEDDAGLEDQARPQSG